MAVTRSKSGKTMATNTMKKDRTNWAAMEIARCIFMEQTYLKQHREKHPHSEITSEVTEAGEKAWVSMNTNEKAPYVTQAEKRLAEFVEGCKQDSTMMVARAKSGTTKKVDNKNAEKTRKKRIPKGASKRSYRDLIDGAFNIFMTEYVKECWEKGIPFKEADDAGEKNWMSMSEGEKAVYVEKHVEMERKKEAERREISRRIRMGE